MVRNAKPGARLTGGWRFNAGKLHFMAAKHIPHSQVQHNTSKAPDRGTVRRSPGAFGLIPGGGRKPQCL
jgi:hypothetical protein